MQKVIGINLNGNAYQVEERGHAALQAYLESAEAQLRNDPDRAEIIADLEQAIAEKCQSVLGPYKSVVTAADVDRIVAEMGPVDGGVATPAGESARGQGAGPADPRENPKAEPAAPKRLYQIREGAMLSGVCNGLAAYFDIDVTLVRIAFVILAILTKGVWILVYIVMTFVIPYANTSEERAEARGRRFSAQDVVDQAKRNFADFKDNPAWTRHWRMQKRQWRRRWHHARDSRWGPEMQGHAAAAAGVWVGLMAPFYAIVSIALLVILVLSLVSLGTTHALFGYAIPPDVPLWFAFLVVIVAYHVIASPFHASRRGVLYLSAPGPHAWMDQLISLLWLGFVVFSVWYGYHHVPAVHDFFVRLPEIWTDFVHELR